MMPGVLEPVSDFITRVRGEIPPITLVQDHPEHGPLGPDVNVPLFVVHLLMNEVERMGAVIVELSGLLVLSGPTEGSA